MKFYSMELPKSRIPDKQQETCIKTTLNRVPDCLNLDSLADLDIWTLVAQWQTY